MLDYGNKEPTNNIYDFIKLRKGEREMFILKNDEYKYLMFFIT